MIQLSGDLWYLCRIIRWFCRRDMYFLHMYLLTCIPIIARGLYLSSYLLSICFRYNLGAGIPNRQIQEIKG